MAVAIDQASVGPVAASSGAATCTLTTDVVVASGGTIVVLAGGFVFGATISIASSPALTWSTAHSATSGNIKAYLFYAHAPSGFASGSTITITRSAGTVDMLMVGSSYTGVDSAMTGAAPSFNATAAGTAAWASGSVAATSGNALIGGCWGDGALRTSTPTGPAVERVDSNSATTNESATIVDKLSVAGSDSLAGTWSGTLTHIAIACEFTAAAGGGGATPAKTLATLGVG